MNEQIADGSRYVAELRQMVAAEYRAWSKIVHDDIDDAGPPPSAIEQLHLIAGTTFIIVFTIVSANL